MILSSENKLINAIGFQAAWWSIAFYQEKAIYLVFFLFFLHFYFLKNKRKVEFTFVLAVSTLGVLMDSLLLKFNVFNFENPLSLNPAIVPLWLIVLWLSFATTLNHSLSWLFKRKTVAFVVGGLGGSLSYIAAANIGTIILVLPKLQSFLILFFLWGLFFLMVRTIGTKLNTRRGVQ